MALLFFPWILPYFFIGHTMTWIPSVVVYEKKVVDVVRRNTTMLKPQTDVSSSVGGQEPFWNPSPTLSPYVGEKVVALTFDDGPNGKTTERLLDILKMERVSVTFFIVGNRVTHRNISVLKRASDEGHEIGNHSWSHPRLTHLSGEQITREIAQTNEKIYEVTGKYPHVLRVPYGVYNGTVEERAKLPLIQWDVDSRDWENRNAAILAKSVIQKAKPGSIILLHDLHPWSVDAVPSIIDGLKSQGYKFVTVSDLIGYDSKKSEQYIGVVYNRIPEKME